MKRHLTSTRESYGHTVQSVAAQSIVHKFLKRSLKGLGGDEKPNVVYSLMHQPRPHPLIIDRFLMHYYRKTYPYWIENLPRDWKYFTTKGVKFGIIISDV